MGKILGLLIVISFVGITGMVHAGDLPAKTEMVASAASKIDTGDTAWILISAALVMLMTPGLALFYGGMVQGEECTRNDHAELRRYCCH